PAPGKLAAAGPSEENETQTKAGWSNTIEAETIEDEIKRLHKRLAEIVTTPGPFKSGGYTAARVNYNELALLFGIIAEYDGEIRWKAKASGLRDAFGRVAANCKVGTDQSYNEAKLRLQDLDELIRGGEVETKPSPP